MAHQMIPRYEDLIPLAEFISEKYASSYPISVTINLPKGEDLLKKINEDYFYRLNPFGDKTQISDDITEIEVKIDGITFKYVEK